MITNELILQQFIDIEKKVAKLVENYKALEETNFKLKHRIEALEKELKTKTEAEDREKAVKTQIRLKIEHLLTRLEDFAET